MFSIPPASNQSRKVVLGIEENINIGAQHQQFSAVAKQ